VSAALPVTRQRDSDLAARVLEMVFMARGVDRELERLTFAGTIRGFRPARRAIWAMIGAGLALEPADVLFGTSRDWPAALGRGVAVATLMRQAFGKEGDPGLGRSLPGGLHDATRNVLLSDGSASAHVLHATGFGTAAQLMGGPGVAVALFGAGAFQSGDVHAAFSQAPLRAARTIYVARGPQGGEDGLAEAADAWGLAYVRVDGDQGGAVHDAVKAARSAALQGRGPTLVDARHGQGELVNQDVLVLQQAGRLSSEAERATEAEVRAAVWAARQSAERASIPRPDTLFDHRLAADEDEAEEELP